ncbi:MAG: 2-hydroxyglutaryl-CoA dehydratase [Acutalibacteraceae bacterium]
MSKKNTKTIGGDEVLLFTKEMKKTHKILVPTMLPMHFRMIVKILGTYGYDMDILDEYGKHISECGLKYVHNDTCYPAILVIGQFINALKSGKYDPDKTALMLMQTGGGCRASNYISLLRKALKKAGYPNVPVVSFTLAGVESHPGFKLTIPILHRLMYAVFYGDLLMLLRNQCTPYELEKGSAERLAEQWTDRLVDEMNDRGALNYQHIKQNYAAIVKDFAKLPRLSVKKVKVGVVGEIFVKYSPLGNNNLESFLMNEGAEVVVPGLMDFCLYCLVNGIYDKELYGTGTLRAAGSRVLYKMLLKKQQDIIDVITENSDFAPPTLFSVTTELTEGYIHHGTKMGEGWLLCAEMLELIHMGVNNIVCTQPFGCLPNHIAGKGMMKPIKERHEGVNIVAIDYDPGATQINQENRLKLMLSNAKMNLENVESDADSSKKEDSSPKREEAFFD